MSAPLIEALTSQGYSLMDAATTAYVTQRKPDRAELTISSDGTVRLSQASTERLKDLRVYKYRDGAVYITVGDAGAVEGYDCLGVPDPESYVIACCLLHDLDPKKARVSAQQEEKEKNNEKEPPDLMLANEHPDCPCWRNNRCTHDPSHPTSCSLPSHVPYSLCALEPDKTRTSTQAGQGCLIMLLPVIFPSVAGLGYLLWHILT